MRKILFLVPDPKIGLIIGQQYHVGVQGKLGAAAIFSDTGLEAITMFFKYIALPSPIFNMSCMSKTNWLL